MQNIRIPGIEIIFVSDPQTIGHSEGGHYRRDSSKKLPIISSIAWRRRWWWFGAAGRHRWRSTVPDGTCAVLICKLNCNINRILIGFFTYSYRRWWWWWLIAIVIVAEATDWSKGSLAVWPLSAFIPFFDRDQRLGRSTCCAHAHTNRRRV